MNLLKAVSLYALTSIILGGINFLLMPVLTFYLSSEDFGYISLITSYNSFLTPVILMGSVGVVTIEYYKLERHDFKIFLTSSLVFPTVLFGFLSGIVLLFFVQLEDVLKIDYRWVMLLPFMGFVGVFFQLQSAIYQIQERPIAYTILNISFVLATTLLSLLLVVEMKWNYNGRLISMLTSSVIFGVISFYLLYKENLLSFKISKEYMRSALKYGLPLIPHSIAFLIIDLSDRIFIAEMVGIEELGVYNIGYQWGVIVLIVVNAFVQGYSPFLFKNLELETFDAKLKIVRVSYLFIVALFVLLFAIYVLSPFIFDTFIDAKFHEGIKYVFWVGLGYVFLGMYKMVVGMIFFRKKTIWLSYLSYLNVVSNLALNYFLIKQFGAIGAAYATALSFLIVFVAAFVISDRLYKMPWLNGKIFSYEKSTH
ncbi:MAG TPA: oligosaccharide flippase family protein [Cytophagaceae bacterium]|jgi:O-antigen/teichoic acid export membrane protein|nr:oligosaccharide flippase family protein [Cytophagaceae bacterium]